MTAMPDKHVFCHVEILTDDPEATARFHEKAYGWKLQRLGPEMGNYILYETPGGLGGGIRRPEEGEAPGTIPYVSTDDLARETSALVAAGAQRVGEPQEVPGWGAMAMFRIPGGALQALWQPNRGA